MSKTELIKKIESDSFMSGYFECLLWASQDDTAINENNLDGNFDEFSILDCTENMLQSTFLDCEKFRLENEKDLEEFDDDNQAGHCFALSRNGHGAGFFDYSGDCCDRLQEASQNFGEVYLFVNEDGMIEIY